MINRITLLSALILFTVAVNAQSKRSDNNNSSIRNYSPDVPGNFSSVIPVVNDSCSTAIDINSLFGGSFQVELVSGPYDNTNATTDPTDPATGWACFAEPDGSANAPELNNTIWFKFTGDGGYYFVESGTCAGVTNYIDGGDTQFALYTGNCGSLTPVKCNEDGPNATSSTYPAGFAFTTTVGVQYYLMTDGFNFVGTLSTGEFCIKVTQLPIINCTDPSITIGTTSQTDSNYCVLDGDTFEIDVAGAIAPNVGDFSGISLVVSTAPLTYKDPNDDPAAIVYYNFANPAPAVFTRKMANNGLFFTAPGTYYFTPIIFGNAVAFSTPTKFLNNLTLDTNCITFGTPAIFTVLNPADPLCNVGITENIKNNNTALQVYPSPATNELNIDFVATKESNAKLSITDITGRKVFVANIATTDGINKYSINVKQLAQGTYSVSVFDDSRISTMKFVKD